MDHLSRRQRKPDRRAFGYPSGLRQADQRSSSAALAPLFAELRCGKRMRDCIVAAQEMKRLPRVGPMAPESSSQLEVEIANSIVMAFNGAERCALASTIAMA